MSKSTDKNKEKDYYLILGANKDETISDIKKKYLKLAIKYHPDKSRNGEDTTEMYELITQAWSVLGNEKKRKEYDKTQNIQKTDHFSIKYEFENFFDLQNKEKPNLEMRKLEFDKINAEMNKKSGFTSKKEDPISLKEMPFLVDDKKQEREQQEIEFTHEKLFDESKQIPTDKFNKLFDEYKKMTEKHEIDLYKGAPSAFNIGSSSGAELSMFAELNGTEDKLNFNEELFPSKDLKKIDLKTVEKKKDEPINFQRMLEEREKETQKLSKLKMEDYVKPDPCDLLLQFEDQ